MDIKIKDVIEKVSLLQALVIKKMEDGDFEGAVEVSDEVARLVWKFAGVVEATKKEEIL